MPKPIVMLKSVSIVTLILLVPFLPVRAQEEVYTVELGGMLGGSFYLGDANYSTFYKNTRPMAGFMGRYIFNPRLALKGNLAVAGIKGSTETTDNQYPFTTSFSRTLYDLGVQFEANFFGYGIGQEFLGHRRFTPYITGGIGMTFAPAPAETVVTANIPIGVGVKYKIRSRWNIGLEFTMRFSLSDDLDVTNSNEALNDPYRIKSGFLKNKDSYSFTAIFVTYDLFPKCGNCNKLED